MCGLVGALQQGRTRAFPHDAVARMADAIAHRGPDDAGTWHDEEAGLGLGSRRLAILDLSAAGHQPMLSSGGRWAIAYNGEIYNHLELRRELEKGARAPSWRGHSDTETLLACVEAWGVDAALRRCVGMFALALWDRSERTLWLARDRLGEKPLYYGWQGDVFLFGSELKALRAHPAFAAVLDRGALALLLRHNYIPAPHSIHEGIRKLPPGTWLRLEQGQREVEPVAYWSLAEVAGQGTAHPFAGSEDEALDELERRLGAAVRGQMLADVPLGALLSGGIDSSLIAALMQAGSTRPVRTFTIGFAEREYDEARHARAVAAHLGTDHTEMRLSATDALALIPGLPAMYDEPFADSSQLPTHLVMKLARRHVTVALSGDAGDEFFAGYNRYVMAPRVWKRLGKLPSPVRNALLGAAAGAPAGLLGRMSGMAQGSDKLRKLARVFAGVELRDIDDVYLALVSEWSDAGDLVLGARRSWNLLDDRSRWPQLADPVARMMVLDGLTYLPDDILTKVDRAAMAVSLETRAPYLDRDVVEFAWSLPMAMKLRSGKGKWLLRRLLDRHVPRELIERPKMGFGIPLDDWLRGPLREWADDLLDEDRLRREGFLDPQPIRKAWTRHRSGSAAFGYRLWSVLMFQAWLQAQQGRG
ncbi:MAG TPA: asparagine synthase (glutamine-hydrolyzing) [Xanthomonadaceae bacterium]|jgi:asparagine synthase (glutamine-hydrolysing)